MPTLRRAEARRIAPLAIVALAATLLVLGAGVTHERQDVLDSAASAWHGLVGEPRPPVSLGQRMIVVLHAPALGGRVARAGGRATDSQERRWTAAAIAAQKQLLAVLAAEGIQVRVDYSYARVLNGFSAPLDARAVALLERRPEVAGVYPVRAAYPASISSQLLVREGLARGAADRPEILLPGFDGRGVTIALLDTGVDRAQPYLRGRVLDGIDVLGDDYGALAKARPDDPTQLERHSTELAGLLVGAGGPAGLAGVATGASILPIRVAGWQRDLTGSWAVYSRTDQLIAGLERAVDPNQDGDAHDAARIALVGLAAPYAAFADGPEARAVAGAMHLDTLVVAPAGNDGPAGPAYGSISSPGGAPAALTVGAADLRAQTAELRVVLRIGLRVPFDRMLPLAGAVVPDRPRELALATPKAPRRPVSATSGFVPPPSVDDFFDSHGISRVAGRAALVPAGDDPGTAAANAGRAGAAAVVLYGNRLPAGALGLDESVAVPVVGISEAVAQEALAALGRGARPAVSLGSPRLARNATVAGIAPFSSRGLAFDGTLKPDVAAPGVALLTAEPGANEDGSPRFGTINGSSAAAATVAGAAAVLAQARPNLDAADLESLIVGFARPLPGTSIAAQGAGAVDLGAAAAAEFSAQPASLTFGQARKAGWHQEQILTLRNVTTRRLRLRLRPEQGGGAGLTITTWPRSVTLRRGATRTVSLRARLVGAPGTSATPAEGTVQILGGGGPPLRIPWTITFGPVPTNLLQGLRLSARSFPPSDTTPAVLSFRAGRLVPSSRGPQVEPVARLDIELRDGAGRLVGLLARLRDLLPGRYAFGITGRDPEGNLLAPGAYRLRLVAVPPSGLPQTRKTVRFRIR
jgi:hypothetical protein